MYVCGASVSSELNMRSESQSGLYTSQTARSYLRFPTTASACADWFSVWVTCESMLRLKSVCAQAVCWGDVFNSCVYHNATKHKHVLFAKGPLQAFLHMVWLFFTSPKAKLPKYVKYIHIPIVSCCGKNYIGSALIYTKLTTDRCAPPK